MSEVNVAPAGYTQFWRTSPFLDLSGPLWSKQADHGLQFALRIDERHCNARNLAHGGVLSGLADIALGYATASSQEPTPNLVTASMTIDFVGPAKSGDLDVTATDIQRVGGRLAFANCYL